MEPYNRAVRKSAEAAQWAIVLVWVLVSPTKTATAALIATVLIFKASDAASMWRQHRQENRN